MASASAAGPQSDRRLCLRPRMIHVTKPLTIRQWLYRVSDEIKKIESGIDGGGST